MECNVIMECDSDSSDSMQKEVEGYVQGAECILTPQQAHKEGDAAVIGHLFVSERHFCLRSRSFSTHCERCSSQTMRRIKV